MKIKYTEEFIIQAAENNNFLLISKYLGAGKPATFECIKCGEQKSLTKSRNIYCNIKCRSKQCFILKYTDENIKNILDSNNYNIINIDKKRKIKVECRTCFNIKTINKMPEFIRKPGCWECMKNEDKNNFIKRVNDLNFTLLSDYTGAHKKYKIKCNNCNLISDSVGYGSILNKKFECECKLLTEYSNRGKYKKYYNEKITGRYLGEIFKNNNIEIFRQFCLKEKIFYKKK